MISRGTFFLQPIKKFRYEMSTQKTNGDCPLGSGKGKPIEKSVWIKLMENTRRYKSQRRYSIKHEYEVFLLQRYEHAKLDLQRVPQECELVNLRIWITKY